MSYIRHKIFLFLADILILTIVDLALPFIIRKTGIDLIPYKPDLIFLYSGTILIIGFYLNNQYKYDVVLNKYLHSISILKSYIGTLLLLIITLFLIRPADLANQIFFYSMILTGQCIVFLLFRVFGVPLFFYLMIKWGIITRNVLIVGINEKAKTIARHINDNRGYYKVRGFVDHNGGVSKGEIEGIAVLGSFNKLFDLVKEFRIHDIIIADNELNYQQLTDLIHKCKVSRRVIHIASSLYDVIPNKIDLEHFGGIAYYRIKPHSYYSLYLFIKRIFDIFMSIISIVLFIPFGLLIAILIKSGSKGPVFYKATVIGKHGIPFQWYKFRSMKINFNDEDHRSRINDVIKGGQIGHKLENDKRITGLGRFIRKYSIDELPQLFNVLKGEMSLVGPRPKLPYEYELMENWQKLRFTVVPGITGLFQIKAKNKVVFNEEIVFDQYYIENRSVKMDIEIVLKTILYVLNGKNN